jgi:O-antigen/teichoic acid export membrane protein
VRVELRTLIGQTAVYGLGGAVAQAIGIVTLPIFARVLDTAEYGVYELYTVGIAMMVMIADLGLGAAAQRSFYDYRDDQLAERRSVVTTAFLTTVAISALLALVILALREPVGAWLAEGDADATVVALAALSLPLLVIGNLTREVLRLTLQPWRYLTSTLLATIGGSLLAVIAVTAFDAGVEGILVGVVAGTSLAMVYGIVVTRTFLRGHYDRHRLAVMLRYGLPLVPALAGLWATAYADRLLLAGIEDLDAVGVYAIAARFAAPVMLVMTAFVTAYHPFLLSLWSTDPARERELRGRLATLVSIVLLGCGLPLAVFGPQLIDIVTPGYDDAAEAISPLVLGIAAFGLASVLGVPPMLHRRTQVTAVLTVVMGIANVALCLALIPWLGVLGAAIASFGGYALLAFLYWWWGRRVDDAPYEPAGLVVAFALAAVAGEAWRIDVDPLVLTLLLKLAVCLGFVAALRLTRVIQPEDLGAVREIVAARLRPAPGA